MNDIIEVKGQYYIRASSSMADATTRVLKHAETFGIFDRHGDVRPLGFENHGIYHEGARFLSRWKMTINGTSPLLLSSNVKEDNDFLVVDLTNPVLRLPNGHTIGHGTIHIVRTIFLWESGFYERTEVVSFALKPVTFTVAFEYQADFIDLFEVRGSHRIRRGEILPHVVDANDVTFSYKGLDSVSRKTRIRFNIAPSDYDHDRAVFELTLKPQEQKYIDSHISFTQNEQKPSNESFHAAQGKVHVAFENYRQGLAILETSNPQFNDWIHQSRADMHLLLTKTAEGPYPYAGIPWFSCIFGRDGIITALETLWIEPDIARGVLTYLAARQATESNPSRDAEPGKILHEERKGEMVTIEEVPFGCYYGAIDSTPLWLILAGSYYERTGDLELMARLWPNVERALTWMDKYGDCDGDGFLDYCRRASGGLHNQGWKDADDSVFHADGTLAEPPIALCEVQGYAYEARLKAAVIAQALGHHDVAANLREVAGKLKTQFHEAFWCENIQSYAIALDGHKKPCRIRASNAGQCLFTGIATPHAAERIKGLLLGEGFFGGWGIRTVAETEARYNPMSYHNGSVWPHDNALIALGLARYGHKEAAAQVLTALFDASQFMDLNRLPELYCGFRRRRGEGPTLYPVACNPQAWSSASIYCVLQACLGIRVNGLEHRVYFDNPYLPPTVQQMEIKGLKVTSGAIDVNLVRHDHGVAVDVRRRTGNVEIIIVH